MGVREYTPERAALHREIVDHLISEAIAAGVPAERKAIMSGGMGGSGKGYILGKLVDKSQYITIDPDHVKEQMLQRGMGPDIPGLQPMESATFIHEESSHISKMLTAQVAAQGLNAVLDTTMATEDSTRKRVNLMIDHGYDVEAVFADVPLHVTEESAMKRYLDASRVYQATGKGFGGRLVIPSYLKASAPSPGSGFDSKNRETLENLRAEGLFSRVQVFDNSDRTQEPVLVYDTAAEAAA